ncbi:MAG: hypothetical protein J6D47_04575 [Peptostreptococcaceae bacterium]|nr:hypothetical protein [Peptostreptococcaceae bacterium]
MKQIGNRIIFDEKGNILFQMGEMEGYVEPRSKIKKLDYIDLEFGAIDYTTHYIESIDVENKKPVIKEYSKQELTDEQMYIKELEEKLAIMESKLLNI